MNRSLYRLTGLLYGIALTIVLATGQFASAQSKPPLEYQVKAAFLFNFTRFIHWPAAAYPSADAPFVIGIIGNDPFGSYLDDIVQGEQVDGHPIVVRRYHDIHDITGCQILFMSINEPARLKEILAQTAHQNILTVSDAPGFINMGGVMRFFKSENRIKIEIKLATAKTMQLQISAKLLNVAKVD